MAELATPIEGINPTFGSREGKIRVGKSIRSLGVGISPVVGGRHYRIVASQVGGLVSKLPSASVKSLSIIGRNGGEGGPPYFNGKGGIAVSQPLLYKLPFAQHDHERRQRIA
ncbi:hypothetical protein L6164_037872 [Bauhinia variegata]|uniref:Uncharacterized protein n=1 Tax=Bauhinia variegata TaxID=167791 RepID=A0ACB9KLG9_BAUVA|nr:hypothetical protein L6164_037872 [Bauhinia variegata]